MRSYQVKAEDLIEQQLNLLISVATGGLAIGTVEREYRLRHRALRALLDDLGVPMPFTWSSLWQWYEFYSGSLPSYAARRAHVTDLAEETLRALARSTPPLGRVVVPRWPEIEQRLRELNDRLVRSRSQDDFRDVGRRSRDIIIDAVNLVFTDDLVPEGEPVPKKGDAKKRLDYVLRGSAHAELRKLMRNALELAHKVTHSASYLNAVAAAQATVLVVRTLGEVRPHGLTVMHAHTAQAVVAQASRSR